MNGVGIKMIHKKHINATYKIYNIWRFLPVVDRGTLKEGYEVYDKHTGEYLWFPTDVVLHGIKWYSGNKDLRNALEEEE